MPLSPRTHALLLLAFLRGGDDGLVVLTTTRMLPAMRGCCIALFVHARRLPRRSRRTQIRFQMIIFQQPGGRVARQGGEGCCITTLHGVPVATRRNGLVTHRGCDCRPRTSLRRQSVKWKSGRVFRTRHAAQRRISIIGCSALAHWYVPVHCRSVVNFACARALVPAGWSPDARSSRERAAAGRFLHCRISASAF